MGEWSFAEKMGLNGGERFGIICVLDYLLSRNPLDVSVVLLLSLGASDRREDVGEVWVDEAKLFMDVVGEIRRQHFYLFIVPDLDILLVEARESLYVGPDMFLLFLHFLCFLFVLFKLFSNPIELRFCVIQ